MNPQLITLVGKNVRVEPIGPLRTRDLRRN